MRIDISPGDRSWEAAEKLLDIVWPDQVMETIGWRGVVWAHAEDSSPHDLVCHVGLFTRNARWNDREVTIGGIGGVATRPEKRKSGLATAAMQAAIQCYAREEKNFAVLLCEPHNYAFYRNLRIRFEVMATFVYDLKLAPRGGMIDLRGLPW